MKKILLFVILMVSAVALQAQDTVYSYNIPDKYFVYKNWWNEVDTLPGKFAMGTTGPCPESTFAMFNNVDDTLTVYGIAASIHPAIDDFPTYTGGQDFSADRAKVKLFMRLYECGTESPRGLPYQIGPDLTICFADSPDYYFSITRPAPSYAINSTLNDPIPVYERYFDEPILVTDSFFVGITMIPDYNVASPNHPEFNLFDMILEAYVTNIYIYDYDAMYAFVSDTCRWARKVLIPQQGDYFLYPIITPNPDTTGGTDTIGGGDTLGVYGADATDRLLRVTPNPATDEVRLTSSLEMQRVEVIDANGRRMHDSPAHGHETTLDLRGWPAGSYVVRVYTPAGLAAKKLIVQRK